MPGMSLFAAALLALGLSAWLTHLFCRPSSRFYMPDKPNRRSLHKRPKPRSGGIAILAGLLAGGMVVALVHGVLSFAWLLAALVPVVGVALLDDRRGVPVPVRLLAQFAGAAVLVWGGSFASRNGLLPGVETSWLLWFGTLILLAYVVWMINLYNFMDGMDGFAAGMGVIGFGFLGVIGWQAGNSLFAQSCLVVVSAAGGFLIFNFPPARIFMGDAGSSTLGFLAAVFSLWGAREEIFPLWAALLIFSPFIVDASVTLVRRLVCGEVIWKAHKTHYYQKLVQAGWGHRKTVLVEYVIMLGCGLTALLTLHATVTVLAVTLAGWVLFYIVFFFWVTRYASGRHAGSV